MTLDENYSTSYGAREAFLDLLDPDLPAERNKFLRQSLLEYCKRDTLALVRLAHFLAKPKVRKVSKTTKTHGSG